MKIKKNDYAFEISKPSQSEIRIYVTKLGDSHLIEPTRCNTTKKYQIVYDDPRRSPSQPDRWKYEFIMRRV